MIDLRSDTVTRPSPAMRTAMMEAPVGDDVYGEDPTVNQLQDDIAALLDTEAALFTPSGTMANQIALHVLTNPGDEVIVDATSHIYNYETGAAGVLSGIQLHPVSTPNGLLTPNSVEEAIRPEGAVFARSQVVALENTANKAGGRVYSLERIQAVTEVAAQEIGQEGVVAQFAGQCPEPLLLAVVQRQLCLPEELALLHPVHGGIHRGRGRGCND